MTAMNISRVRFFLPEARLLDQDEIVSMLPEKKKAAEGAARKGLWLEMTCPDDSCIDDQGNIHIPAKGLEATAKKGIFLKLFCPGDSCEVYRTTDLP